MIQLIVDDEFGVPFAIDTFLTLDDAKDALNQLECSLEGCVTSARANYLMCTIDQLKQSIAEYE